VPLPIWGFVAVTLPLVCSPGPSTAVVLRNSIAAGTRGGFFTALGANTGSSCYGFLVAFGLAAAVRRWPAVWLVLRWGGVIYLTWLGLGSLYRACRPGVSRVAAAGDSPRSWWQSYVSGFLTNVLNPSLAAFYLIVLPQFIPRQAPFAVAVLSLTAIHVGMALSWHLAWALAGATLARALSRRRPRQLLDAVTGITLLVVAASVVGKG
jgi:threonine/homoserine/homoserine lactone efflux protein